MLKALNIIIRPQTMIAHNANVNTNFSWGGGGGGLTYIIYLKKNKNLLSNVNWLEKERKSNDMHLDGVNK